MSNRSGRFVFIFFFVSLLSNSFSGIFAQGADKIRLKADEQFINQHFKDAADAYEDYLKKDPKNFYASRQAAISYSKLNNQSKAIDHWVNVYENVQASDKDKLEYAKCLLSNYRTDEAKKIFISLSKSPDPAVASWGIAYSDPTVFYEDSAQCKIFNVMGPNSSKQEYAPLLYRENLIFVRAPGKKRFQLFNKFKKEKSSNVFISERTDSITFKKPGTFNLPIQNKYVNGALCFTPDDSTMYFTRSAPANLTKKASKGKAQSLKLQIFYTAMNMFGLAHMEIHPFVYNSFDYNCMHPSISADGKKLYFASDMPGTLGGTDIFICEWINGAWDKPKNLGPQINSVGNESYPDITAEGILYFSSDGRPGLGGLDIFYADPTNNDKLFAEAVNAGAPINSQANDFSFFCSKNPKKGYFSSNRKESGDDDIYLAYNNKPRSFKAKIRFVDSVNLRSIRVSFTMTAGAQTYEQKLDSGMYFNTRLKAGKEITIKGSREGFRVKHFIKNVMPEDTLITVLMHRKSLQCIEGKIIDKDNNLPLSEASVAIYDEEGNKYLDVKTDSTGIYKVCFLPLGKPLYIGSQKKPDYFTNTEKFTIKKDTDLLKNIFAQKIVVGKAIKVENIYFDKGKFNVRPDAALELDKLVRLMKDNPDIIIELSSHTDCVGPAPANLLLSDKRAKSSAAYIISKGVDRNRIKGKGYGETQPLNDCKCEGKIQTTCSEDQLAQNRRTEFKVTGFVGKKK